MNAFDVSPTSQYQSPPVQPTDMPTAPTVGAPPRPPVPWAPHITESLQTLRPLKVEQVEKPPTARPKRHGGGVLCSGGARWWMPT